MKHLAIPVSSVQVQDPATECCSVLPQTEMTNENAAIYLS